MKASFFRYDVITLRVIVSVSTNSAIYTIHVLEEMVDLEWKEWVRGLEAEVSS